nr:hypothetical protein [uncultured bacterium]
MSFPEKWSGVASLTAGKGLRRGETNTITSIRTSLWMDKCQPPVTEYRTDAMKGPSMSGNFTGKARTPEWFEPKVRFIFGAELFTSAPPFGGSP